MATEEVDMSSVMISTVLGAPVAQVWPLLRDFAAIASWHPYLTECQIENGPADRVGCSRVFRTYGNHRETLAGLDDQARMVSYVFDDSAGLPVRDYGCVLRVVPVTDVDRTFVQWEARFDCDAADEDNVMAQVRQFLVPGLAALAQRFSPAVAR
jgi:Polyketide cyclase / dehydrase and lipid transport